MSMKTIIEQLDRLLEPLGFTRQKAVWNRRVDSFLDVADIQVSKAGDAITINVGVLDFDVHRVLEDGAPPEFVEQPICTVAARVGELIDGRDKWWQVGNPGVADELAAQISTYILPFFERMHAREAMRQWLIATNVTKKRYPPSIINLAILENLLGNAAQGCALLAELQKTSVGAWRARVTEVVERLHCI